MCGIGGFQSNRYDENHLWNMADAISHRGPDGADIFYDVDSRLGLVHTRLSIIDLDVRASQPMRTSDNRFVITFNGEIYNYPQLKEELLKEGVQFRTTSDTEVLLYGYALWGERVLEKCEGMFAFVIYDFKTGELFAARDRLGIKPFYYTHDGSSFVFGSEVKAILTCTGQRTINKRALLSYFRYGYCHPEITLFDGIEQLPAGHSLRYRNSQVTTKRYWEVPQGVDEGRSLADIASELRDHLIEATSSHMIADVDVGLTLSGGLDSSCLLACLGGITDSAKLKQIQACTVGYGMHDDEQHFARALVERYPVQHNVKLLNFNDATSILPKIMYHLEEPLAHIGVATTYFLAEYMRSFTPVTLIGEGSDELFGGYPYYKVYENPFNAMLPSVAKHKLLSYRPYKMPHARHIRSLLTDEYCPSVEDEQWLDHFVAEKFSARAEMSDMLRYELQHELVGSQLTRIDKLTMAHGLEARVPFLDRKFVEYAMHIPSRYKRNGERDKFILREAFDSLLVPTVSERPKAGKGGTQSITGIWYKQSLEKYSRSMLSDERLQRAGMLQPKVAKSWLDASPRMLLPQIVGQRKVVFFLTMLQLWHETFLQSDIQGLVGTHSAQLYSARTRRDNATQDRAVCAS